LFLGVNKWNVKRNVTTSAGGEKNVTELKLEFFFEFFVISMYIVANPSRDEDNFF
jgi:hypothetical protein